MIDVGEMESDKLLYRVQDQRVYFYLSQDLWLRLPSPPRRD